MRTEDTDEAPFSGFSEPLDRLAPDRGWNDMVLPERLVELIRRICIEFRQGGPAAPARSPAQTNGRSGGLIALFVGERGTGKTTVARLMGSELGLGVLRVDLARLSSTDPEQTERSLRHALSMARESGEILFLDNAETLLGKRQPPARERTRRSRVPVEVMASLLDAHPGLIVVSAELKARLDDQLLERVDYEVDFPFPQTDARERIWRLRLPGNVRIDDAQFNFLAASFKLSGAAIERGARFAESEATAASVPVDMRHVALALEREYGDRLVGMQTRAAIARVHELIRSGDPWVVAEGESAPTKPELSSLRQPIPVPERKPKREPKRQPEPRRPQPEPTLQREPVPRRQPATAPAPTRATGNRRLAFLTLGGVFVAALLGFLLARAMNGSSTSASGLHQRASAGLLRVSFPADWARRTPPATPALGLTDELALAPSRPAGGLLIVGRATTAGPSVLLPPSLISATGHLGQAQLTTLNGAHYYRYLDQAVRGLTGPASLYVLPAGAGTIFGLCEKQGSDPAFAGTCERIVGTVRPVSGGLLRVSLSPSYASGLTAAMAKFSAERSTAATALARARSAKAQATAAGALAAAHLRAAAAVAQLTGAGTAQAANLALAAALRKIGDAYQSLARAAAAGDARAYAAASSKVSATAAELAAALTQLGKVGYVAG